MDFREEYKKSAAEINPDQETVDRMKAAVMARLSEENITSEPERKKPPLKKIAFIGGAAAACAVITVSAVSLLPANNQSITGNEFQQSPSVNANSFYEENDECLPEIGIITAEDSAADTAAGITYNPTANSEYKENDAYDGGAEDIDEIYDEECDVEEDVVADEAALELLEFDGNSITYCGIVYALDDACEAGSIADPIYELAECMADGKQYTVMLNADRSFLELYTEAGDFLGSYVPE